MQALPHMWRMSAVEHQRAQALLQHAIGSIPTTPAHALLGWTYVSMFNLDARPLSEFTDNAIAAAPRRFPSTIKNPGHLVFGLGHARRRRSELASQSFVKTDRSHTASPRTRRLGYALHAAATQNAGSIAGAGTEAQSSRSFRDLCAHCPDTLGAVRPRAI